MLLPKTRGLDEFNAYISSLARNSRGVATEAITDYLIGTPQRGLKRYVAYRHVRREAAYGRAFVSDRQRRFVMAMIRQGRIDPGAPHRTGNFQRSWHREGRGVNSRIAGELPHETWPNKLAKMIGWRDTMTIIGTNLKGACLAAERAIVKKR